MVKAKAKKAAAQSEAFICRKCKHKECSIALRIIKVTVGWGKTQLASVGPARMCTKCGDKTTAVNVEIGDLAGVTIDEVEQAAPPAPNRKTRRAAGSKKASKKKGTKKRK